MKCYYYGTSESMKMLHPPQFLFRDVCVCVCVQVRHYGMQEHTFQLHPLGSDVPPAASSFHLTVITLCH